MSLVEEVAYLVSGDNEYWFYEFPNTDSDRERHREKAREIVALVQGWKDNNEDR